MDENSRCKNIIITTHTLRVSGPTINEPNTKMDTKKNRYNIILYFTNLTNYIIVQYKQIFYVIMLVEQILFA